MRGWWRIVGTIVLGWWWWAVVSASSVREQFTAFESVALFDEQTLYTFIQDKELLAWAQAVCSTYALEIGDRFGVKLSELIDARFSRLSDAEMLLESLELRNRVHAMHQRLPRQLSDDDLCIRKILMYMLQKHLRKRHIQLIEQEGLIDDFNTVDPPLRAVELKEQVLQALIDQTRRLSSREIKTTVVNPEFLQTLSSDERLLAERSREVMVVALASVLDEFVQKWWFTEDDVNMLADVVVLEYTADCWSVAGKYEVSYQVDKNWQKKNVRTTALHLTVSTCTKIWFVVQKLWLSRLIAMHELGHHVWWYKDPSPEQFTNLCWKDEQTRNDRCVERDFVSAYAQTAPQEDYAEHFQQWVIKRRARPWFIDTKLRYFDRLFGQEK